MSDSTPLTFTAAQAGSTVQMIVHSGSPTVSGLHYRLGTSGEWLAYTIGDTITLAAVEDSVQFWNSSSKLSRQNNIAKFVMSGVISGKGDIMSLLNWSDTCPDYCFWLLFDACSALIQAPDYTAKTLGNACYGSMLRGTSIIHSPKVLAESFAYNSCLGMFANCTSLVDIPVFHSTAFVSNCLRGAFRGCTSLTSVKIRATELGARCCESLFDGCSALVDIEADIPSWGTLGTEFTNWVRGVAASGTFIKPRRLPKTYGSSNIPSGWRV